MPTYKHTGIPPAVEKNLETLNARVSEHEEKHEETSAHVDFLMMMQGIDIHEGEEEEEGANEQGGEQD